VSLDYQFPTFDSTLLPHFQVSEYPKSKIFRPLTMTPTRFIEKSVTDFPVTPCDIPEELSALDYHLFREEL
jgi:hypothetical protein